MRSAVCTVFEGDYHLGVGALVNSLYTNGFRGNFYAGYRGPLPPWAVPLKSGDHGSAFEVAEGLTVHFIPLTTKIHLANYKPDFMLSLGEKPFPPAEAVFYFDPDITVKCPWSFFEEWVKAGVAVCVDINPDMAANHPIRHAWKGFLMGLDLKVHNEFEQYFNSGFVGVAARDRDFLVHWKNFIQSIGQATGGLDKIIVASRTEKFYCPDQDGLNLAAMATESSVSPMGQDAMDFQHGGGGYVMSHAAGGKKPWKKPFVRTVLLRAAPPSRADREFFRHVESPIRLFPPWQRAFQRLQLLTACFLGRFMRNM